MSKRITHYTVRRMLPVAAMLATCLLGGPARADLNVPTPCELGAGTYTGDLAGGAPEAQWGTESGATKVTFIEAIAGAYLNETPDATTFVQVPITIQNNGQFTGMITTGTGGNTLAIQGTFSVLTTRCEMSGQWTLTRTGQSTLHGTFMAATGDYPPGVLGLSGCGSSCGPAGMGSMMATAVSLVGYRSLRRRRRP
ncbi:MAG: hypothetical protein U1A27_01765 [Phycisphaerae bacterium]